MNDFTSRLTQWRDKHGLTNAEAAGRVSRLIGYRIAPRTFEGWAQGRLPAHSMQSWVLLKIGRRAG